MREACADGALNAVELLLEAGADGHVKEARPLELAAREGHTDIVKRLLKANANIHADNALMWGAIAGQSGSVKVLLEAGADVLYEHDRALSWAAHKGHHEVLELLIEAGADVHAKNEAALRVASLKGQTSTVKLLLEAGADVHAKNEAALRFASLKGQTSTVKLLLEAGADVHAKYEEALRVASLKGQTSTVKLLLEAGAKTSTQSADVHALDERPLRAACKRGRTSMVQLLLEAGAKVHENALAVAHEQGHTDIVEMLESHAASPSECSHPDQTILVSEQFEQNLSESSDERSSKAEVKDQYLVETDVAEATAWVRPVDAANSYQVTAQDLFDVQQKLTELAGLAQQLQLTNSLSSEQLKQIREVQAEIRSEVTKMTPNPAANSQPGVSTDPEKEQGNGLDRSRRRLENIVHAVMHKRASLKDGKGESVEDHGAENDLQEARIHTIVNPEVEISTDHIARPPNGAPGDVANFLETPTLPPSKVNIPPSVEAVPISPPQPSSISEDDKLQLFEDMLHTAMTQLTKLAEGQGRLEEGQGRLEEGQKKVLNGVTKVSEQVLTLQKQFLTPWTFLILPVDVSQMERYAAARHPPGQSPSPGLEKLKIKVTSSILSHFKLRFVCEHAEGCHVLKEGYELQGATELGKHVIPYLGFVVKLLSGALGFGLNLAAPGLSAAVGSLPVTLGYVEQVTQLLTNYVQEYADTKLEDVKNALERDDNVDTVQEAVGPGKGRAEMEINGDVFKKEFNKHNGPEVSQWIKEFMDGKNYAVSLHIDEETGRTIWLCRDHHDDFKPVIVEHGNGESPAKSAADGPVDQKLDTSSTITMQRVPSMEPPAPLPNAKPAAASSALKGGSSFTSDEDLSEYTLGDGEGDERRINTIESLSYIMRGSYFLKYDRYNTKRELRYFWFNLNFRTLNWAVRPPGKGEKIMQTKAAYIDSIQWVASSKGQSREYGLTIGTPSRDIRVVTTNWYDHHQWITGPDLLLKRSASQTPLYEQFLFVDGVGSGDGSSQTVTTARTSMIPRQVADRDRMVARWVQ
ncbi:hypothetical protein HK104_010381 [Borealophlyctis nickersoniae]|nr:hypothetical protein HK104_010381 [Borealophlyctis nickersoniae]